MNGKNIVFAIVFLLALAIVSATPLPLTVDSVKVDGVLLTQNSLTRLNLERSQEVEVEIRFTASDNMDNVEVHTFLSGFEYSDVDPIHSFIAPLRLEKGVSYSKRLNLKLSKLLEQDNYKLRVLLTDKDNNELQQNFNIRVDVPRHSVEVKDILLSPENEVRAGYALLAKVRVDNRGQKDEKDVKVTASIPELNLQASAYLDDVSKGDTQEDTEELFLRLPKCASAGMYNLKVDVLYDEGRSKTTASKQFKVTENEACDKNKAETTATLGFSSGRVEQGGSLVVPVTVFNGDKTAKSFTLTATTSEGLDVNLQPSATLIVESNQAQTFTVQLNPDEDLNAGSHVVALTVNSGIDVVKQASFTANVFTSNKSWISTGALEVGLLVLVGLVIVVGLVIGFSKFSKEETTTSKKKAKAEPYY